MNLIDLVWDLFRRRKRPPAPPPQPPDPGPPDVGPGLVRLLELINALRLARGMAALRQNDALGRAAQAHAGWMAAHRTMTHVGEGDHVYRAQRAGYWGPVGENVAAGQRTPAEVYSSWVNSPGHRKIMLDDYVDAGVGQAVGADGLWYWCLVVGRPN